MATTSAIYSTSGRSCYDLFVLIADGELGVLCNFLLKSTIRNDNDVDDYLINLQRFHKYYTGRISHDIERGRRISEEMAVDKADWRDKIKEIIDMMKVTTVEIITTLQIQSLR